MLSKKDYLEAIEEVIEECKAPIYKDDVVAIYLGGSVARGDFSPGRSDIDIYIVVSGKKEEIEKELKDKTRKIAIKHLSALMEVHSEPIGISLTTIDEIKEGKSWLGSGFEYHNFINTGKLLYGGEIKTLIQKPTREQEMALARQALGGICSLIKHLSYSSESGNDMLVSQAFSTIFRTASLSLCGEGKYVSGKKETVLAFQEIYAQESELCRVISQSFELWEKWEARSLTQEEIKQLMGFCLEFVSKICSLWDVTNKGEQA